VFIPVLTPGRIRPVQVFVARYVVASHLAINILRHAPKKLKGIVMFLRFGKLRIENPCQAVGMLEDCGVEAFPFRDQPGTEVSKAVIGTAAPQHIGSSPKVPVLAGDHFSVEMVVKTGHFLGGQPAK
jgi:hypothetical protein